LDDPDPRVEAAGDGERPQNGVLLEVAALEPANQLVEDVDYPNHGSDGEVGRGVGEAAGVPGGLDRPPLADSD
jgi:hypothetical protein